MMVHYVKPKPKRSYDVIGLLSPPAPASCPQPQISFAASTTSASLARCSCVRRQPQEPRTPHEPLTSSVIGFPSNTDANPHCGLMEILAHGVSTRIAPPPQRRHSLLQCILDRSFRLAPGEDLCGLMHPSLDRFDVLQLRKAPPRKLRNKGIVPFRQCNLLRRSWS